MDSTIPIIVLPEHISPEHKFLLAQQTAEKALRQAQATKELEAMTMINTTFSSYGWSVVCPNHHNDVPLPILVATPSASLRTLDYIFPPTQSTPHPTPKTFLINIMERNASESHDFEHFITLWTGAGTPQESGVDFEGFGKLEILQSPGSSPTWSLQIRCKVVEGTGTGIFEGITGGHLSCQADWNDEIQVPAGPEEWAGPLARRRPAYFTFLFEKRFADALQYATLGECF